jgi:hypothetical protein
VEQLQSYVDTFRDCLVRREHVMPLAEQKMAKRRQED